MYTRSRQKKLCRSNPVAIESKLKPLPNIGSCTSPKVTGTHACRTRNVGTVGRHGARSSDRSVRSGSITERETAPVLLGKPFYPVNKRAREGLMYKAYGRRSDTNIASNDAVSTPPFQTGRSSDTFFEDPTRRPMLADPYAELRSNLDSDVPMDANAPWWLFLAEMKLQARRQAVNLDSKPEPLSNRLEDKLDTNLETRLEVSRSKRLPAKLEIKPDAHQEEKPKQSSYSDEDDTKCVMENDESPMEGTPTEGVDTPKTKENNSEDDAKAKDDSGGHDDNDNDEDEDEEEDESGLPQAVRAMQPKPNTLNARDVVRERHRAMMEEIARTVSKSNLITHLRTEGFFNYDYSQHARTNLTNHNLKKGKKKGIERLLLVLACRTSKCTSELYGV